MPVDDSYTKVLLHFNGSDASTTFTDESGKTWTANGNAQIDTAQSVFGGASGLFPGTLDHTIVTPDHADWQLDGGSNSNLWTIDFRVRFNSVAAEQGFVEQYVDNDNYWAVYWKQSENNLVFIHVEGTSITIEIKKSWTPVTNTWYHVAVVKNGTSGYMMFIDGTQIGTTETDTSTMQNFGAQLQAGQYTRNSTPLNGWMDELRISKGIARWTANFTPPTAPYGGSGGQIIFF